MKVTNTKKSGNLYHVDLEPSWLERLFGVKPKTTTLKGTGRYYVCGGQKIYVYKDGSETGNGDYIAEAIDKWNNKF